MRARETRDSTLWFVLLFLGLLLLVTGDFAQAKPETVNPAVNVVRFQEGVLPSPSSTGFFRDTYLNSSTADSAKNHGAADSIRVSGGGYSSTFKSQRNRALFWFDLAAMLPAGAEIRRCRLYLYSLRQNTGSNSDTLEARRVLMPWAEGTGGNDGAVQTASADWRDRGNGKQWNAAGASAIVTGTTWRALTSEWQSGGDSTSIWSNVAFAGDDSLSFGLAISQGWDVSATASYQMLQVGPTAFSLGWMAIDLTRIARGWNSTAFENYGVLLQAHNNVNNKIWAYASREHPYVLRRPIVEIEYLLPQEGSGSGGGLATLGVRQGGGIGIRQ